MGNTLSVDEALHVTVNELGVEDTHVHCWQSYNNTVGTVCLVEEKWLQDLRSGLYNKPQNYSGTAYERFLLLQPSNQEIPKSWTRVSLKIFRKPLKKLRIPKHTEDIEILENNSFADLMSYVSTENFKNYLLQASKKCSTNSLFEETKPDVASEEDVIIYLAKYVFGLEIIKLDHPSSSEQSSVGHASKENSIVDEETYIKLSKQTLFSFVPIFGIIESTNAFFIVEPFIPHCLQDVVWFSPSVMISTVAKPLFLLYQILRLFETFHWLHYYCSVSTLQDILISKCLWLSLSTTNVSLEKSDAELFNNKTFTDTPSRNTTPNKLDESSIDLSFTSVGSLAVPVAQTIGLPKLVEMWVRKEVSNFDYLMALNTIAGRRFGDPNYHPVLPWVTDFTRPKGNYRDLTKSKFRINKGDNQLDLTYKGMSDADGDVTENPAHHVSGVLSEITYHMYLARRTPKSVLQKHVRAKWEPNEYPSNVQRLQEWTPDECIPEFYTDATIFESIHADLPDLGVPKWAETPEDFIRLHRAALESEYVCSHLHHWIDLTFGYKLVGVAAEKAKNVCLHLVDNHQSVANHGVLPLFLEPHPAQQQHHEMVLYPSTVNFEDGLDHEMRRDRLAEFSAEEGLPSSSWDDVDVSVETADDELTASATNFKKQKRGRSNFPAFLRLKDSVESSTDAVPSIDSLPISLPIGYDPLEMFDQIQLLTKFKLQNKQLDMAAERTFQSHSKVKLLPRENIPETARHKEIQNLCSMIMEMFLPAKMRLLSNDLSQKDRFIAATRVFRAGKFAVPGVLRHGVKTLFDEGLGLHDRQGLAPLTPELLLHTHVSIFPFPSYFNRLYEFLVEFYSGHPSINDLTPEERTEGIRARMSMPNNGSCTLYQVDVTIQYLPELLGELNEEGLDLLITFLTPLFDSPDTQLQAFLHLFDPLAAYLGPKKARKVFLKLLLKQYDVRLSSASVVLFHQSFLSKLIMRFGMEEFLNHFITFIVDALNLSSKDGQEIAETYSQDEVPGVILEDEKDLEKEEKQDCEDNTSDILSSGEMEPAEPESVVVADDLSDGAETPRDQVSKTESAEQPGTSLFLELNVKQSKAEGHNRVPVDNGLFGEEDEPEDEVETIERTVMALKRTFSNSEDYFNDGSMLDGSFERSVSFHSENPKCRDSEEEVIMDGGGGVNGEVDISEAAAESLCWMSPRLGPLLTSNYVTKPLLLMLIKCYVGVVGMGDKGMAVGDENAKWILHCLGRFTDIYGEAVIFYQYLPFITSKVNVTSENVSVKGEANLAGALVLVRHCVLNLSKESLVTHFQELCHQILHQILCLVSSGTISFASGAPARTFLALLTVKILENTCEILERDRAQEHLSSLIRTFFSSFDKAFRVLGSDDALNVADVTPQPCTKEIQETFIASLAHHAYITLCKSLGDSYMETTLCNNDLIWQLCCSVDTALSNTSSMTFEPKVILDDGEEQSRTSNNDVGELTADTKSSQATFLDRSPSPNVEMRKDGSLERDASTPEEPRTTFLSSRQHLTGNWLEYWKHNLGKRSRVDGHSFSQLKLQTFTGHSDAIKDLCLLDSEHVFLSASRDKTVKLWLLSNHGAGSGQSACSWTAYDHRKPVFAVDAVDAMRQAVSCDGSVHIWDLTTGSSVVKLNFPKSNQAVAMTKVPSPSSCVVAAMQNSTVRFIDTREGNFGHTWKVTSSNVAGLIRSICVNQEGTSMAVGFSGGFLSVIDLRGGILTRQWRAHETDVLQVKSYTSSSFVTSSTQRMELWRYDGVSLASLPVVNGSWESVHKICVRDKVIVSCAANNRMGWHTFNENEPTYSNVRLGSAFKGNLTCFGVLPLNRAYLFGSDNGNITLMA